MSVREIKGSPFVADETSGRLVGVQSPVDGTVERFVSIGLPPTTFTASAAVPSSRPTLLKLNNAGALVALTLDQIEAGRLYAILQIDAGTQGHTVTLDSGTWDGTNTIATFNAQDDLLVVLGLDDGLGVVLVNYGVTLS